VLKDVDVTPDEVASFYAAHRDTYSSATGLYAREIRVKTREAVDAALRSIASGCAFADVAREVSTAPTASRGGLAYYEARALPPRFARAMAPLADGQMSGVVRSNLGYHIFLLERRSGGQSLDRIRDRVADDVRANKNEQLVEANLERLLDDAKVTINRDRLPFQYEGRFAP
jgi:parvulin-like peptidyl-prolyl isomerase